MFSKAEVQSCIVHQIRNLLKYVASNDQKNIKHLMPVYKAVDKTSAELELDKLAEKWQEK